MERNAQIITGDFAEAVVLAQEKHQLSIKTTLNLAVLFSSLGINLHDNQ